MQMSKNKSIKYQVEGMLRDKLAIGQSRHEAKIEAENNPAGIYSWGTYNSYKACDIRFANWVKENYHIKTVADMKSYAKEYIRYRQEQNMSAWTVSSESAAIAKMYGCGIRDLGIDTITRNRSAIKRSRGEVKDFNVNKHADLVNFCRATGLRRHEILQVKAKDISWRGTELVVHVNQGKGGQPRDVPVLAVHEQDVLKLSKNLKPEDKLFPKEKVPSMAPIHKYRAEYAKEQYNHIARDLNTLSRNEKYYCRKDKKGVVYNRQALRAVSEMLGHHRIDVIAEHYLY